MTAQIKEEVQYCNESTGLWSLWQGLYGDISCMTENFKVAIKVIPKAEH